MTPTAAAARATSSAPSLRDRLKDPSLLREQCYIDGAWTGTPANPVTNPVNGVETGEGAEAEHGGSDASGGGRRAGIFRPGPSSPPSSAPISCANGSTSSSPTVKTSR